MSHQALSHAHHCATQVPLTLDARTKLKVPQRLQENRLRLPKNPYATLDKSIRDALQSVMLLVCMTEDVTIETLRKIRSSK